VLGVASIVIANLMALIQRNVKRMLGWLVIAQSGAWVLTFVVGGSVAYGALLFALISYGLVMLGAFGVVMTLKGGGRELERLEHFAGIAESRKGLAAMMTLFMLALAGVPGTVGFWARWHLVGALVAGGLIIDNAEQMQDLRVVRLSLQRLHVEYLGIGQLPGLMRRDGLLDDGLIVGHLRQLPHGVLRLSPLVRMRELRLRGRFGAFSVPSHSSNRFLSRSNSANPLRRIGTIRIAPAIKPPMCAHQATPPPSLPVAAEAEKNCNPIHNPSTTQAGRLRMR